MDYYYLKGHLKPLSWFLVNGWKCQGNSIVELNTEFQLSYKELDSELYLKEITDYICHLELEDDNGTQYMRKWFEVLNVNPS